MSQAKNKNSDQLSLFDIVLPENTGEQVKPVIEKTEQPRTYCGAVTMARVPDEEFIPRPIDKVPTVQDLLRQLDRSTFRVSRHEFLSDVFECGAIAISNKFDIRHIEEREKQYLRIIKKYDKTMQQLIADMFANIYSLLTHQIDVGFADYLGELYMRSDTSNSKSGQFFTPYDISKACAMITINESLVNDAIEKDRILTLNEPTCGSGGMVLAAADVLYNKYHFNYSRNLLVECSDIDSRCVHMAYLQLSLAGIPAIIYHRDTLSLETWDRWETPPYIMQWPRFKNVFKGTMSDVQPKGA